MQLFQQLGDEIENLWRGANYNEEMLPSIAADALSRADLPPKVSAWDVIEWTLRQTELPRQKDVRANFGDPPITIYVGPRFHIDVYFWFEGTTAIHQHGFAGAFQVLLGSSIHSRYEFEKLEAINVFTEIGEMKLQVCELLEVGAVQEINPGRKYIHSLFHLDHPSATIVVRTDKSPMYLPQYSYHKPFLALDPFFENETVTKKLQSISALIRAKHPETDRMVGDLLNNSDFQTTFHILSTVHTHLRSDHLDQLFNLASPKKRFESFLEISTKRHGESAKIFTEVFSHIDKLNEILRRRNLITDPQHRFFFALLLNVAGRDNIFSLIKQRFPESDPLEKVLDWTFDLARTRIVGPTTQNALGFESFDDFDMFLFEYLLKGRSDVEIKVAVAAEYPAEKSAELLSQIAERIATLRAAVIFEPLLS